MSHEQQMIPTHAQQMKSSLHIFPRVPMEPIYNVRANDILVNMFIFAIN